MKNKTIKWNKQMTKILSQKYEKKLANKRLNNIMDFYSKPTITNPNCYKETVANCKRCAFLSWFRVEDLENRVSFITIRNVLTKLDYEHGQ